MDYPYELIVRDIPRTEGLEQKIEEKVEKLGTFYDRISHCRVTIEAPERGRRKGAAFKVSIELGVPGADLIANREGEPSPNNETLTPAIREAFKAMQRQLRDYIEKKRRRPQKDVEEV